MACGVSQKEKLDCLPAGFKLLLMIIPGTPLRFLLPFASHSPFSRFFYSFLMKNEFHAAFLVRKGQNSFLKWFGFTCAYSWITLNIFL
jgi:hypothetical protein